MIPSLLLFLLVLCVQPTPHIPSSYVTETTDCALEFNNTIRDIYPDYGIASGTLFIAQFDVASCTVLSEQVRDEDTALQTVCLQSNSAVKCTDQTSSVIRVESGDVYYCGTHYSQPQSYKATLGDDGLYEYTSEGLLDLCLYDADRNAVVIQSDTGTLYTGTDDNIAGRANYRYLEPPEYTPKDVSLSVTQGVDKYIGMFLRGDFVYSIFMDTSNKARISRSCKVEPADTIMTYTYADVKCELPVEGSGVVDFTKVLWMEYSTSLDLLFVLFSRVPTSLSAASLCTFDISGIDDIFDTSSYIYYDQDGAEQKKKVDKLDCSVTGRSRPVLPDCDEAVSSTDVVLMRLSDLSAFALYETFGSLLIYVVKADTLYIYKYSSSSSSSLLHTVALPADHVTAISIYLDKYFLQSGAVMYSGDPYWCGYYGKDPVLCLATRHPSCSYTTTRHECIPTVQCGTTDCKQSLEDGTFSTAFPEGYSYTVEGEVCTEGAFTDLVYTYSPNTTLIVTSIHTRDCGVGPTAPVIDDDTSWSSRETGLLVGLVVVSTGFLLLLLLLLRSSSKVSMCSGVAPSPYAEDTARTTSIFSVFKIFSKKSNETQSSHTPVFRNRSNSAAELAP